MFSLSAAKCCPLFFQKISTHKVFARGILFFYASSPCRRYGTGVDLYRSSKQLSEYMKMGRIRNAQNLFDEIIEKNVVAWSIMVHGYSKNGFYEKALEFFTAMRNSGIVPNSFTFVGVLVGISGLEDMALARVVHGLIVKTGWEFNSVVATALLDTYSRCRFIGDSYKVFDTIRLESVVPWNAMMSGFVYNELFTEAFCLFNRFRESGFAPNSVTVMILTQGCVAMKSMHLCESVHSVCIKFGLVHDIEVSNALLSMYSTLTDLHVAAEVFNEMEDKDVISWSTMMSLLVRHEYVSDALKLFFQMKGFEASYDTGVLVNLISACGLLGNLKMGKSVHAQTIINGFESNIHLANAIITMYARFADLDSSTTLFDQSTMKNVVSWTSMISGFLLNRRPREALDIFIGARKEEGFSADPIILVNTLTAAGELGVLDLCMQLHCYGFVAGFINYRCVPNCLISVYSKCGNVELAHSVFMHMSWLRNIISWNALIYGYGINGHGETALSLYNEFRKCGGIPDAATYLCVLSACSRAEMINEGLMIFSKMLEEDDIRVSEEHYGCVVDLLARAGYLSDASELMDGRDQNAWKALLNGCVLHGDMKLAEVAVRRLHEQAEADPEQAVLLSNLYALVGRFQDAEALRLNMVGKKSMKDPGLSFLSGNLYNGG
ncbi:pentatricopeptide repeat-containing protein At3g03580-like [Ipomoea triloba]|uniref:pentatricopeptide repeat-containing protein At3g03580-like n=1 Tax=Ipomoea triloba TaxID=35885 RepID=UPI00125D8447|nr:pentatricopeptide repeat-containing protein At3g03580-like [Ipomoea triloba]